MNIVKLALLGSLRIVSFGSLKVALCAYILFLSHTAYAGTAREDNGHVAGTASDATPERSIPTSGKRAATLPAARARPESLQGVLKCSPSKMQGRKDVLTP